MHRQVFSILGFLVTFTIHVTVLVALVLPILFPTALLAWIMFRRPMSNQGSMDSDLEYFRIKTGEVAGK